MKMKDMDGRKPEHDILTEICKYAVAMLQSGEGPEVVYETDKGLFGD